MSMLASSIAKLPPVAPAKKEIKPTEEQIAVIEAAVALRPGEALVIEAGAGTGKTSTLAMLADKMPGRGQYTAFNSALVKESTAKFPSHVPCNTTHSLAFRAVGKRYAHRLNGARVKSWQIAEILGIRKMELSLTTSDGTEKTKTLDASFLAGQLVGAIRKFCQSADPAIAGNHFRYLDGIDTPIGGDRTYANNSRVREYLLPFAEKAWADIGKTDGQVPIFTHDCYVKLWQLDRPVISADYILLDEDQDTAPVMLDILRQQKSTKTILVGDAAQQIYEWRGAVNATAAYPDAAKRYLSQSFRFGQAIAEVANSVLETLEEPTGLVLKGLPSISSTVGPVSNPRCILCRTNAAAISNLLAGIAAGKNPFLVGGGSDVISFVEAAGNLQAGRSTSHPELACFSNWTEVQDYAKMDEGEDLKLMVSLIDKFGCQTILKALKGMPTEDKADLVISTAHKSKGREWDTVRLASDFPTADKSADSDKKLLYVAVTRAKLRLDVSECPFFTGEEQDRYSEDDFDDEDDRVTKRSSRINVVQTPESEVVIEVIKVETNKAEPEAKQLTHEKPAPAKNGNGDFTWARARDGSKDWQVRGPVGYEGEEVEVTRKDGSKSRKLLRKEVEELNDGIALYKV